MKRILLGLMVMVVSTGCGSTPQGSSATDNGGAADAGASSPALAPLSDSVAVAEIALYQAVKTTIVKGGARAKANAPIVAGRPALVRVGVAFGDGWQPKPLTGELHLSVGGDEVDVLKDEGKTIAGPANDGDLGSTFNFTVDGDKLTADTTYTVIVRDPTMPSDRPESSVSYPGDGSSEPTGAQVGAEQLKVKIVPVQYQPSGTSAPLLPDASAAQIQRFHDTLFKMYPTAKVDITVRSPLPWTQPIAPDGTGWDELITAIMDLRATDHEADDVFYVGAFIATSSIDEFCANGCVLGVAQLADPMDVAARMALVADYSGQLAPDTLNQELAHAMGREHANCGGADSPDPAFPYKNAKIGVWGYDLLKKSLVDPNGKARDFMGYCDPIWISDYTYSALFKRIAYVNKQKRTMNAPAKYRALHLAANGALTWGRTVTLTSEPAGDAREVTFVAANGVEIGRAPGHMYRRDTLPGALILVREPDAAAARARVLGLGVNTVVEAARP